MRKFLVASGAWLLGLVVMGAIHEHLARAEAAEALRIELSPAALMRKARLAYHQGNLSLALGAATEAVKADAKNGDVYYTRGQIYEALKQPEKAVADYTAALELDAPAIDFYQLRGAAYFKMGKVQESIADFDHYLELQPARIPHHWQRGISYYYAERYADGRRQFELHQKVNDNDVENAVWHFMCVARMDGVEQARSLLIDVKPDPRIPMPEVHRLFAGKGSAAEVIKAAEAGHTSVAELKQQLFYAHLYLGLYYEALGDLVKAKDHMKKAAGPYGADHYMGDVARVHLMLRGW